MTRSRTRRGAIPFLLLGLAPAVASAQSMSARVRAVSTYNSISWGDFNADGLADAYVALANGDCKLLSNRGDGQFDDVTAEAGLAGVTGANVALWSDVDGDDRLDLFLANQHGPSHLYQQTSEGTFVDVTATAGLDGVHGTLAARFFDYDADGFVDLQVTTMEGERVFHGIGQGRFEELDLGLTAPFRGSLLVDVLADDMLRSAVEGDIAGVGGATGGGTLNAMLPPGATVTSGGSGLPAPPLVICASMVEDLATGACLPASGVPVLGALYPITTELFVDSATGNVGMGTTSPGEELDVVGDVRASGRLISSVGAGAPIVVNSASLVSNLNADLLDGFHATDFSMFGSTIETAELADGAVTNPKLALDSVLSVNVVDNSLTASDLAANSVGASEIAAGAVGTSEVADNSLTAADLAANSVGASEIAAGAVGTSEVADNSLTAADLAVDSVGASEIAAGAVGNSELGTGVVSTAKILNGTIIDADVSTNAQIAGTKIVPDFGSQDVTTTGEGSFSALGLAIGLGAVEGIGTLGPTVGYLGAQGQDDFSGVLTADWLALEIGVVGISTGTSVPDNFGVMGHSNNVGVRGEHASDPTHDWGELGTANIGVLANGNLAGVSATNSFDARSLGQLGLSDFGVYGEGGLAGGKFGNTVDSTLLDGARGVTSNSSGYGLWGVNTSFTGSVARGVYGSTFSASSFGVYASGGMGGTGGKYFINPHPTDATKEIRFISLEGNESGTYFRGTSRIVDGAAIVDVPEVFSMVTNPENLSIQLTPVGGPATLWVESQDLEQVVVRGTLDVEFHYFVNGIRRGFEDHQIIHENGSYLPERLDEEYGTQYPESYRQILVENGILNPDFTPNAATLMQLETKLEHYRTRMESVRREIALSELAHANEEATATVSVDD